MRSVWQPFGLGTLGLVGIACAGMTVLGAKPASAQNAITPADTVSLPATSGWQDGSLSGGVNLGLGSAVGLGGVTVAYVPVLPWEMEIGVGAGVTGIQCSVMQKLVMGTGPRRTMVGLGLSLAPSFEGSQGHRRSVWWLNLDLWGFEWRTQSPSRIAMSFSLGLTVVLDQALPAFGSDPSCGDGCGFRVLPQFRFIAGRWR
jgi:hypothetical protein